MTRNEWSKFVTESRTRTDWDGAAKRRLERADASAKYESEKKELAFKQEIGADDGAALETKDAFEKACKNHVLIGKQVNPENLPWGLARTMSKKAWGRAIQNGLGSLARNGVTGGRDVSAPPEGEWWKAVDLIERESLFSPGPPQKRCVFAQVDPRDTPVEDALGPRCEYLEKARTFQDRVPGHSPSTPASLADAVVWLSAGERRKQGDEMVLVYYKSSDVAPHRYPVPPDGGTHERFRPAPEEADVPFGKTLPEGVPESEHLTSELSVWEVVHENKKLGVDDVWVFGLGPVRVFQRRAL